FGGFVDRENCCTTVQHYGGCSARIEGLKCCLCSSETERPRHSRHWAQPFRQTDQLTHLIRGEKVLVDGTLEGQGPKIIARCNCDRSEPPQTRGREELLVVRVLGNFVGCVQIEVRSHPIARQKWNQTVSFITFDPTLAYVSFERGSHRATEWYCRKMTF